MDGLAVRSADALGAGVFRDPQRVRWVLLQPEADAAAKRFGSLAGLGEKRATEAREARETLRALLEADLPGESPEHIEMLLDLMQTTARQGMSSYVAGTPSPAAATPAAKATERRPDLPGYTSNRVERDPGIVSACGLIGVAKSLGVGRAPRQLQLLVVLVDQVEGLGAELPARESRDRVQKKLSVGREPLTGAGGAGQVHDGGQICRVEVLLDEPASRYLHPVATRGGCVKIVEQQHVEPAVEAVKVGVHVASRC